MKKHRTGKLLCVLLTLCMILSIASVTVSADPKALNFADVKPDDWYYDAVEFCFEEGLMMGTDNDMFSPSDTLTRAMAATILYRLLGTPSADGLENPFTDVPEGEWYSDAVKWMSMMDYVNGYGNGLFGPEDNVTKEQAAAMLYRIIDERVFPPSGFHIGIDYLDIEEVSDWAYAEVYTLNRMGIFNQIPGARFNPQTPAARAEMASMLFGFYAVTGEDYFDNVMDHLLALADLEDLMFIAADPYLWGYIDLEETVACMVDTHLAEDHERILLVPLKDGLNISVDIVESGGEAFIVKENIAEFSADTGETVMLFAPILETPNVMVTVIWDGMSEVWVNSIYSNAGQYGTEWLTGWYDEDDYDDFWFESKFFYVIENLCDETVNLLKKGMVAVWLNDYEVIGGEGCWKIAIGTGNEEHFAAEFIYAVGEDSGEIYRYDVITDNWSAVDNNQ